MHTHICTHTQTPARWGTEIHTHTTHALSLGSVGTNKYILYLFYDVQRTKTFVRFSSPGFAIRKHSPGFLRTVFVRCTLLISIRVPSLVASRNMYVLISSTHPGFLLQCVFWVCLCLRSAGAPPFGGYTAIAWKLRMVHNKFPAP